MQDFAILGKCETCKKRKAFIKKRKVPLPTGDTATSKKKMCNDCYQRVLEMLKLK